jgi:uncharacterized surface anchored protein
MQIKNFKKKFMAFALSAFTVVSLASGFMQPVSANDGLTYNGIGQSASEGKFLLDVKNSTVDVNGTEISSADGSRQEVDNGTVLKIKDASYIVVFNKDGSQESYKGDLDYQTTSNTAYVSVLGGVQQGRRRNRRSTGDVNALVVGDTFSGTFGTNNTDPTLGVDTFYVDAITGLLAQVSNQIIGSQYVTCQEHGYIGLTNINAWSNGQKAEYTYNATVTSVAPDGTVTLAIDVPHYLKPGTSEEATGYNLDMGGTVPYQRCAGTWVIKTAPRTMQMYVKVHKHNGNTDITENNECYAQNLSGAVYGVFADEACTNKLGEITTDVNGDGVLQNITVNPGIYVYVKELKAPKGFNLDTKIYPVYSLSHDAKGWDVDSTDYPMNDPVAIKLTKKSEDNVENPASLEGAEFTVKYYAGQYTKETLPGTATRTWVIKTLQNNSGKYITRLGDKYKVSGDDFYIEPNTGAPTLPLGTITVEETKAPEGYTLKNKTLNANNEDIADGVALFNITENLQGIPQMVGGNEYTIEEGVKRSGFSIQKVDEDTNKPVGSAEFKILNANNYDVQFNHKDGTSEIIKAGEQSVETIVTDENGAYTSALDALQTGTYKLVETKAPEGYFINQYTDFEISNEAEANVVATNVTVKEMKIRTKALEKESQKNVLDGSKTKQTIEDTMPYDHFVTAKEYTVKTTYAIKPAGKTDEELRKMSPEEFELVKDENGVVVEQVTTVSVTSPNGEVKTYTEINPSKYAGHKLVAFEEVYLGDLLVGRHKDITDENQTVTVSMDLELSIVKADKDNTSKVLKGAEFTVYNQDGTVAKDKNGKDAVGVTDENGKVTFKLAYDQDNEMYVMETKAPEGYTLSTEKYPVKRTGKDKLGVDQVTITVLDDKVPPTGVKSNTLVFAGIAIVAVLALGVLIVTKKKEDK